MRRKTALVLVLGAAVASVLLALAPCRGRARQDTAGPAPEVGTSPVRGVAPQPPRAAPPDADRDAPPAAARDAGPPAVPLDIAGVLRSADGEPLAGANLGIRALRETAGRSETVGDAIVVVTGPDGRFEARGVPAAVLQIRAVAQGFVTAWFQGAVHGDGTPLELRVRRSASMRVAVVDAEGAPVAGATVGLFPMPRVTFAGHFKTLLRCDRTTTTGADGTCVLTGIDARRFRIAATAEGRGLAGEEVSYGVAGLRLVLDGTDRGGHRWVYQGMSRAPHRPEVPPDEHGPRGLPPHPGAASVDPSEPAPGDEPAEPDPSAEDADATGAPLEPGAGEVVAVVLSADGSPVPDAWVRVQRVEDHDRDLALGGPAGPGRLGLEQTGGDGTARIAVEPGTYDVAARPDRLSGVRSETTIQVAAGERRRVEMRLADLVAVPVVVRAASGRRVGSAHLEFRSGDDTFRARTSDDGRATLLAVRGRELTVAVSAAGFPAGRSAPVSVPPAEPVMVLLHDVPTLRGRVVDPSGAPLFGVEVEVRPSGAAPGDEAPWAARTDDRGAFAVEGPPPGGSFDVLASAPAYRETVAREVHVPRDGDLVIRVAERPLLRGRVLGPDSAPLAGAWVVCEEGRGGSLVTSSDGTFALPLRLAADEVSLGIGHEGCAPQTVRARLCEPCEVRLECEARDGGGDGR